MLIYRFTGSFFFFLLIVINIDLSPRHSRSIFSLLLVAKIGSDLLLVKIVFLDFCICIPNLLGFSGSFSTCKCAQTSPRSSSDRPLEGRAWHLVCTWFGSIQQPHEVMFFSIVTQELAFVFYFLLVSQASQAIILIARYGKWKWLLP